MAAAAASKIAVANPVVDLDGDEMTRWAGSTATGHFSHMVLTRCSAAAFGALAVVACKQQELVAAASQPSSLA